MTRRALLLLLPVVAAAPAGAVITRLYPLADVVRDSDVIMALEVSARDPGKQHATLKRARLLKGQTAWSGGLLKLTSGDDKSQVPVLHARLAPKRRVLVFARGGKMALGYVEGTWFRAVPAPGSRTDWQLVHLEPYLRRTFRGPSAELEKAVGDGLAGKKLPAPDPKVKPGVGP